MGQVSQGYSVKEIQYILDDTWTLELVDQYEEIIEELSLEFDDMYSVTELRIIDCMFKERKKKILKWMEQSSN